MTLQCHEQRLSMHILLQMDLYTGRDPRLILPSYFVLALKKQVIWMHIISP